MYLGDKPVDQHFFSSTAYVHQVDLFFATLTVREHLQFHAMVRVRKEVAVPDRLKRVEEVRYFVFVFGLGFVWLWPGVVS